MFVACCGSVEEGNGDDFDVAAGYFGGAHGLSSVDRAGSVFLFEDPERVGSDLSFVDFRVGLAAEKPSACSGDRWVGERVVGLVGGFCSSGRIGSGRTFEFCRTDFGTSGGGWPRQLVTAGSGSVVCVWGSGWGFGGEEEPLTRLFRGWMGFGCGGFLWGKVLRLGVSGGSHSGRMRRGGRSGAWTGAGRRPVGMGRLGVERQATVGDSAIFGWTGCGAMGTSSGSFRAVGESGDGKEWNGLESGAGRRGGSDVAPALPERRRTRLW